MQTALDSTCSCTAVCTISILTDLKNILPANISSVIMCVPISVEWTSNTNHISINYYYQSVISFEWISQTAWQTSLNLFIFVQITLSLSLSDSSEAVSQSVKQTVTRYLRMERTNRTEWRGHTIEAKCYYLRGNFEKMQMWHMKQPFKPSVFVLSARIVFHLLLSYVIHRL